MPAHSVRLAHLTWFFARAVAPLWLALGIFTVPPLAAAPPAEPAARADIVCRPEAVEVLPQAVVLDGPRAGCQLIVTGRHADGIRRDLTPFAELRPEADILTPEPGGFLKPRRDGETVLLVRAGELEARVPVTVRHTTEPRPVSFRHEVVAALNVGGCNQGACHGTPNGKNGFRLSLRGADPAADFLALTRDQLGRRADRLDPAESLMLRKGQGTMPHEGGVRWRTGGNAVECVRGWLAGGLPDDPPGLPGVVRLEIVPGERVAMSPARWQQLAAVAHFADGSSRDVTRLTVFSTSDATVADVSEAGRVEFQRAGEVAVLCRYLETMQTVRLTYLEPKPGFVWPDPAEYNAVDRHVFAKLWQFQIAPSDVCTDAEFLRRVSLDLTGALPTPDQARAFLADPSSDKRSKLIDRLLESPAYADFWALKWADLLRSSRKAVQVKGALGVQEWLRTHLAADTPFDQVVRELLTASGSSADHPAANYFRVARDPQSLAETTAQLFCGIRLQCAKCHNHPFERWTQDDYYGLSAYFARVRTKPDPAQTPAGRGATPAAEVVYADRAGEVTHPRSGHRVAPRPLGGPAAEPDPARDRREALADWLAAPGNPFFARSMANRVWFHLFGRGIVEPVDDFRDSNPPASAELLDFLARDFAKHHFRLKHLIRTVLDSRAYQLSARTNPTNTADGRLFSHAMPRLLTAEQLLDALCDVTGVPERYAGLPPGTRAVQLPDGEMNHPFLKSFGQPARELPCECERDGDSNLTQALQLTSGPTLHEKLRQPENRIGRLLASNRPAGEMLEELYLAALGRPPLPAEVEAARTYLAQATDPRKGWEDVLWALFNSHEFLFRR
jgi:hypothetical protein